MNLLPCNNAINVTFLSFLVHNAVHIIRLYFSEIRANSYEVSHSIFWLFAKLLTTDGLRRIVRIPVDVHAMAMILEAWDDCSADIQHALYKTDEGHSLYTFAKV